MRAASPAERRGRFAACAELAWRRPGATIGAVALLAGLSLVSGARVQFRSDIAALAPAGVAAEMERLGEAFGATDQLIILVSSEERPAESRLLAFAAALESVLRSEPRLRSLEYGWEALEESLLGGELLSWAPLWARGSMLDELEGLLAPEGLRAAIRKQALLLDAPGLGGAERWVERDPLEMRRFLLSRLDAGASGFRFQSGSRHFLSPDGASLLIRIKGRVRASEIEEVKALVAAVRRAEAEAVRAAGGSPAAAELSIGHTGGYAFAVESERVLREDLTRNISLSVFLVLAVLSCAWRRPLLVLASGAPVAAGIILGFGLFSLFRSEVVSLALVSGGVLAALGIDFSIHLLEPVRRRGRVDHDTVLAAASITGRSLLLAAGTTAMGFFSFILVSGGFLRDLGLLSGLGILACLACALLLLPALLALGARGRDEPPHAGEAGLEASRRPLAGAFCGHVAAAAARNPARVLLSASVLAIAAAAYLAAPPPGIETDLRRLQVRDSEALEVERRVHEVFRAQGEPVLIILEEHGGTADEASLEGWKESAEGKLLEGLLRLSEELDRLRRAGITSGWRSALDLLPAPSEQAAVRERLAAVDAERLAADFLAALEAEGFDSGAFAGAARALDLAVRRRSPLTSAALASQALGGPLAELLAARGGEAFALVAVHPAAALWSAGERERLSSALRDAVERAGVAGSLAGSYFASALAAEHVTGQFFAASGLALLIVAVVSLALFRHPLEAAAALAPVLLGCLFMAVVWDLLGYRLNYMNAGILPVVLGIGVDHGIHLVARFDRGAGGGVKEVFDATGSALVLTTLTTLAAFGTLAFSVSPGLASVGILLSLGVTFSLAASILLLPAMLVLAFPQDAERRAPA
jgi:predicted RND superfamily exporter protein